MHLGSTTAAGQKKLQIRNYFEPQASSAIGLYLRRTLVLLVLYSIDKKPQKTREHLQQESL
jgi:hypothetical protein